MTLATSESQTLPAITNGLVTGAAVCGLILTAAFFVNETSDDEPAPATTPSRSAPAQR